MNTRYFFDEIAKDVKVVRWSEKSVVSPAKSGARPKFKPLYRDKLLPC